MNPIYSVNDDLYKQLELLSKRRCTCKDGLDKFHECGTKSDIIADMVEVANRIYKNYDRIDKVKNKIIEERLYEALKYAPLAQDIEYVDILNLGVEGRLTEVMFLTFNPSPKQDLQVCIDAVQNYLLRTKYIQKAMYVIEQREEDFMMLGKGFHFHMLIWNNCEKYSYFRRDARRHFDKLCDVEKLGCVKFRTKNTALDIEHRID